MSVRFFSIFRFALHWSCSASGNRQTWRAAIAGHGLRGSLAARGWDCKCDCAIHWAGRAIRSGCCTAREYLRSNLFRMRRDLHAGYNVRESGRRATRHVESSVLRVTDSAALRSTASFFASVQSDFRLAPADVRKPGIGESGTALYCRETHAASMSEHVERFEYGRRADWLLRLLVFLLRSSCERSGCRPASESSGSRNVFRNFCNFGRSSRVSFRFAHGFCFRIATVVDWRGRACSSLGGERMRLITAVVLAPTLLQLAYTWWHQTLLGWICS